MKTFLIILGFLLTIAGALLADLTDLHVTAFVLAFIGISLSIIAGLYKLDLR
jgi:heme O synthase-like polyprenyltransferase